jgi:hypothetical protein
MWPVGVTVGADQESALLAIAEAIARDVVEDAVIRPGGAGTVEVVGSFRSSGLTAAMRELEQQAQGVIAQRFPRSGGYVLVGTAFSN